MALFKDPPAKEDCPICFLPMPAKEICCVSLPPATISSVPINDFDVANEEFDLDTEMYYECCGKSICRGCLHSFSISVNQGNWKSGNDGKCPFCNVISIDNTDNEQVERIMKGVEATDAHLMCMLAYLYHHGNCGLQQNHGKAMELYAKAAELGSSMAHSCLANIYYQGGDFKKAKFYLEAGAMAGHEVARFNIGCIDGTSGNVEQAVKHWTIAASVGSYQAMDALIKQFEEGEVSRESIETTLTAYNISCTKMRSEGRDTFI